MYYWSAHYFPATYNSKLCVANNNLVVNIGRKEFLSFLTFYISLPYLISLYMKSFIWIYCWVKIFFLRYSQHVRAGRHSTPVYLGGFFNFFFSFTELCHPVTRLVQQYSSYCLLYIIPCKHPETSYSNLDSIYSSSPSLNIRYWPSAATE